eukprot:3221501-Amphidinium_carterae.1
MQSAKNAMWQRCLACQAKVAPVPEVTLIAFITLCTSWYLPFTRYSAAGSDSGILKLVAIGMVLLRGTWSSQHNCSFALKGC